MNDGKSQQFTKLQTMMDNGHIVNLLYAVWTLLRGALMKHLVKMSVDNKLSQFVDDEHINKSIKIEKLL